MNNSKDLIKIISQLVPSCELNENEKKKIKRISIAYPDQIIKRAIGTSFLKLLYNAENITHDEIADFLNYAEGIAYNLTATPIEQEIAHVLNLGNIAIQDWQYNDAQELLSGYALELIIHGLKEDEIVKNVKLILLITKKSISWKNWQENVLLFIHNNDIKAA